MRRLDACQIVVGLLSMLLVGTPLIGCAKKKPAKSETVQAETVTENPLRPSPGGAPAQGVVRRGAQRQVNQQLLRNIGQYHALFRTENGRSPRDMQEFLAYVKNDPNARTANVPQALESGWVVMVFTHEPSANAVLAYEKEAFQTFQNRLVLLGDGNSVKLMTEPEFQAALKAQ
jgi:hypothetical protein